MDDYQRLVDDIRSWLHAPDASQGHVLRDLAQDYAEKCRDANQRLRRCDDFLKRGLDSEAIHLAETEPILLDTVAILDFPERPQWEQTVQQHGFPAPPPLRLEVAETLNAAYARLQPLEPLLKQHRRLALMRAPLGERLAVLRQLATEDGGNTAWKDDISTFEKARWQQLEKEVGEAARFGNTATLNALIRELQQTAWQQPPPDAVLRTIYQPLLETLSTDLEQAFTANDARRATALRDQWQGLTRQLEPDPDSVLARRNEKVFRWLSQEEARQAEELEFQALLSRLEGALQTARPLDEVEQLVTELGRFRKPVPRYLLDGVKGRRAHARDRERRQEVVILWVALGVGVLVLLGIVGFLVSRSG